MFNLSKNRKEMTEQEILKYANANLWYLREGDCLPALLGDMDGGHGAVSFGQLKEMRRLGTLYPTREVAMIVSGRVRALLSQASPECLLSTNKPRDNA